MGSSLELRKDQDSRSRNRTKEEGKAKKGCIESIDQVVDCDRRAALPGGTTAESTLGGIQNASLP